MLRAVIDVGSNSIKMRIARVTRGRVHVIRDETEVVHLCRGMWESGYLQVERMRVSSDALCRMAARASRMGAEITVVGTMALRTARNADEFMRMVKDAAGITIHVLTGEEEAEYSWLGAVDGLGLEGSAVMFDSGGGSTEFVSGTIGGAAPGITRVVSVPVGAVSLTDKFFRVHDEPVKRVVCDAAVTYVKEMLRRYCIQDFRPYAGQVIGVGGGAVTMAGVKRACENFNPSVLHGSILTRQDIMRQINMYSSLTLKERAGVIGLPAARAEVILGSACIVEAALELLLSVSCVISINGLRHGLLIRDNIE